MRTNTSPAPATGCSTSTTRDGFPGDSANTARIGFNSQGRKMDPTIYSLSAHGQTSPADAAGRSRLMPRRLAARGKLDCSLKCRIASLTPLSEAHGQRLMRLERVHLHRIELVQPETNIPIRARVGVVV